MQWVIKFLSKRLQKEEDIAAFHGSIASQGRKFAESARMARERIPQLKRLITIAKALPPETPAPVEVKKKKSAELNQLDLFK